VSNVTSLFGEKPPELGAPNEALIHMLEDVLAMAKSGRLQCMIATGFTMEGNRLSLWSGEHPNVYEMLGSLSWLQHEYVDRIQGRVT
jgi:hypothetical protein